MSSVTDMRHYLLLCLVSLLTGQVSSHSCETAQQCTPTPLAADSILVQCIDNDCLCNNECFSYELYVSNISDSCLLNAICYSYSSLSDTCNLTTRSAASGVLYALFLGYVGASNYYVGNYSSAIVQSFFFVVLIAYSVILCMVNTRCYLRHKNKYSSSRRWFIYAAGSVIAVVMLSIIVFIWWVVEIYLFATNNKLDSNMCPLRVS